MPDNRRMDSSAHPRLAAWKEGASLPPSPAANITSGAEHDPKSARFSNRILEGVGYAEEAVAKARTVVKASFILGMYKE